MQVKAKSPAGKLEKLFRFARKADRLSERIPKTDDRRGADKPYRHKELPDGMEKERREPRWTEQVRMDLNQGNGGIERDKLHIIGKAIRGTVRALKSTYGKVRNPGKEFGELLED